MSLSEWNSSCPVPADGSFAERITLAHGEGGRLTRRLIEEHIRPRLANTWLMDSADAAHLPLQSGRMALTTDGFVVLPLFFPGGDIGTLAVYGTVNDLAVSGAIPRWLSLAMIVEEGFPLPLFDQILDSVAAAARRCEIAVTTGDTKVVPRGAADGLFLTTTGLGELIDPVPPGPQSIQPGDVLIVSGPIGRHGIAVLTAREQLAFEPPPQSDSAPLVEAVSLLRERVGPRIRAIRDATRGGVAAVLQEWAGASGLTMTVCERQIPLTSDVRGACELLGLDPLHVACEGTMVITVDSTAADVALSALQSRTETRLAAVIGNVGPKGTSPVTIRRTLGPEQALDEPLGAPLPRIC